MLTGAAPFVGDTPAATALAHVNAPVPDVRELRRDVPITMATTIRTAMAKDPADRFTDAAEMQAALNDSGTATAVDIAPRAVAPEPTQVMTPAGYRRAKPPAWWLVGVAALVLAAGSLVWYLSRDGAGEPPAAASPTTLPATTVPMSIEGVIAAFQANPDLYGQQHTATIVDELVKIQQGDDASARAAGLLETVTAWVESEEVTPAALALLEPILAPLIQPAEVDADDAGNENDNNGNGNGGNGNGNGGNGNNGNGNGNGGNGNGKND
jgi:serine/threonine-protein kinase